MVKPVSSAHLILATRQRDVATVAELLKEDPSVASAVTDGGETALHIAAHNGDEEVCKMLLGITTSNIDTPTPVEKLTPLHIVSARGNLQIVELLLSYGAAAATTDARGYTALHHAAWKGHGPVCRALIGSNEIAVDITASSSKEETPLAMAALMRREECVRVLLKYSADVSLVASDNDKEYVEKVRATKPPPKPKERSGLSTVLAMEQSQDGGSMVSGQRGSGNRTTAGSARLRLITPVEVPSPGVPSPSAASEDDARSVYSLTPSRKGGSNTTPGSPMASPVRRSTTGPGNSNSRSTFKGVVPLPTGQRRAHPMYKPVHPNKQSSQKANDKQEEEEEVVPESIAMKGLPDGLLLDYNSQLVFYQAPAQGQSGVLRGGVSPLLVGKLHGAGLGQSKVVPVSTDDVATLELCPAVLRSLKRSNKAARWLSDQCEVKADLAPEVGCKSLVSGVPLVVPLCALLGLTEVSELRQLTPGDLESVDVDVGFLEEIIAALEDGEMNGEGGGPEGKSKSHQQPATPTLPQLLVEYGLVKLIPLAGDLGAATNIQKWHTLAPAATNCVTLSRLESARLRELNTRIKMLQELDLGMRAESMALLQRLSTGSIVLYEVMCRVPPPADRGSLLLGIIIDDLGPAAEKRFKVRDLVDDAIVRAAAGQLARASPAKAMTHLRSDLLPPLTRGAPVLPKTAVRGLPVQLAYDHWRDGPDSPELEGVNIMSARYLVGFLVEQADPDGLSWQVKWPDGKIRVHATGANNLFDLAHLQLHRSAGAPLLRTHVHTLLSGAEASCLPVVRSPLWARTATDDTVPGSVGVAVLDSSQTALQVLWSRSRSNNRHSPMYSPDGRGVYPLNHGIMERQPVTMFSAKEGLTVEPGPGFIPEEGTANGAGVLLYPTRLAKGGRIVVWEVRWPSGAVTEHPLGTEIPKNPGLLVSCNFMSEQQADRVNILNEVHGLRQVGALGGAAYTPGTHELGRSHFGKGAAALISGAAPIETQPLLLGNLVKLNMMAMHLQPGCAYGPLASYEPVPLAVQLKAKKEGRRLVPPQRDDVGVVVRDLGRGVYRGLMVRKLGSTDGWWYDETVLLPADDGDVAKQIARVGPDYTMPRHMQGVVVTDANSAPGMLVQRAYRIGAAKDGSSKAMMIGTLVSKPGPHSWRVQWPDGTSQVYFTGANGRFQLCFAQTHWLAGAPLMAGTTRATDGSNQERIAVVDCMHAVGGGVPPGTVRYVNDPPTQAALLQAEVAMMEPADVVATSLGERCFAGGLLGLYELAHAVIPGDWVTIYSAKRGLRVELHTSKRKKPPPQADGSPAPAEEDGEEAVTRARRPKGTLLQPIKLSSIKVKGILDEDGNRTRDHVRLDPKKVYWDVQWDDGTVGQYSIGVKEGDTSLQVLGHDLQLVAPLVSEREHYLRYMESVSLLDAGNGSINSTLADMAEPFHKAVQWHNQLLQELCNVWWSSAAVACAAAKKKRGVQEDSFPLWRPQIELLGYQPDQLVMQISAREAPWLNFEVVDRDPEGVLTKHVSQAADRRLATAVHSLVKALGNVKAEIGKARPGVHLALNDTSSFLDPDFVMDTDSKMVPASGTLAPLISDLNSSLAILRAELQGYNDPSLENLAEMCDIDLSVEPSLGVLSITAAADGNSPGITCSGPSAPPEEDENGVAQPRAVGSGVLAWIVQEDTPACLKVPSIVKEKSGGDAKAEKEEEEEKEGEEAEEVHEEERKREEEEATRAKRAEQEKAEQDNIILGEATLLARSQDISYVGPTTLLASGVQSQVHAALLQLQRSLCALSCASAMEGSGEGNRSLRLVGKAPCLWLEAYELDLVEGAMPKDPAVARCRSAVNSSIFNLWRLMSGLGDACGGSGDIADGLMETLRIAHAKATAQVASESAHRASKASITASESVSQMMSEAADISEGISSFAAEAVHFLLSKVDLCLRRLHFAQKSAKTTAQHAAKAAPPETYIWETEDITRSESAQESARKAMSICQDNTRQAFPDMANATMKAAESVLESMCDSLASSEELFGDATKAKAKADKLNKDMEECMKSRGSAMTDVQTYRDEQERHMKEATKWQASLAEAENEEDRVKYRQATEKYHEDARASADGAQKAEQRLKECQDKLKVIAEDAVAAADGADEALRRATLKEPTKATFEKETLDGEFCSKVSRVESLASTVDQARSAVLAAVASLQMLNTLKENLPEALRSADGARRMLDTLFAKVAEKAVKATAEWARTASLVFSKHALELEIEERKAARSAQLAKVVAKEEEEVRKFNSWCQDWRNNMATEAGPSEISPALRGLDLPPQPFKPKLPDEEMLDEMVKAGSQHLPAAIDVFVELRNKVDPNTKLEMEDGVLRSALTKSCACLESIAKLAADSNKAANLAAAMAELAPAEGEPPIAPEEVSVRYVGLAIKNERKAQYASDALTAIMASITKDVESDAATVTPPALVKSVTASSRMGANAMKGAAQETVRAINDQLKVLGASATSSGLKAKALSWVSQETATPLKAAIFVREAVAKLEEASAEATRMIADLQPPPPPPHKEEGEGEAAAEEEAEKPAKPQKSKEEILEMERGIKAFLSGAAAIVAEGSASLGSKLIDPISDPGSLPKPVLPLKNGQKPDPNAVDDEDNPSVDKMLMVMEVLPEVLGSCDKAMHSAGTHPDLIKVEDTVQSLMKFVSEAARRRVEDYVEEFKRAVRSEEEAWDLYGPRSQAVVSACRQALEGAELVMNAAKLIMPPLEAERKMREAAEFFLELCKLERQLEKPATDHANKKKSNETEDPEERLEKAERTGCTLKMRLLLIPAAGSNALKRKNSLNTLGSSLAPPTAKEISSQPWDVVMQFTPETEEQPAISLQQWKEMLENEATLSVEEMAAEDVLFKEMVDNGDTELEANSAAVNAALRRPCIAALLRPYAILMQARNKSAAAAMAADGYCPDVMELMSNALLGSTEVPGHVVSSNLRQFRRWDMSIANMMASSQMVLRGFMRARLMVLEELAPIEVPADENMPAH